MVCGGTCRWTSMQGLWGGMGAKRLKQHIQECRAKQDMSTTGIDEVRFCDGVQFDIFEDFFHVPNSLQVRETLEGAAGCVCALTSISQCAIC